MSDANIEWIYSAVPKPDTAFAELAMKYQNTLTKPPGSLGRLESVAIQFCAWQKTLSPKLDDIQIRVYAGDHGVCEKGVSAFPQIVTTQMVQNFVSGGAAISVLSQYLKADFSVVNMGTANPLLSEEGVVQFPVAAGTKDFSEQEAMNDLECAKALCFGRDSVGTTALPDLFIGGEMGIGNTTSASAIYAALLNIDAKHSVGPGAGVDAAGIARKVQVIHKALNLHKYALSTPLSILRCLGGFEIAGLIGAYIKSAQQGIPIFVDGFISTAAALIACEINPEVKGWMLFSHQSSEPAHSKALDYLGVQPLLDLGMRLGEGSGAAIAVSVLQSALLLHNNMATFEQAGVSDK